MERPKMIKRELTLLKRLDILDSRSNKLLVQLEAITKELEDIRVEVSELSKEIAVAQAKASNDKLDNYRY